MPEHGDHTTFVADGHDAASSLLALDDMRAGYRRTSHWLTPSGKPIVEGATYEAEWRLRFRMVRGDGRVRVLKLRGGWHIISEGVPPQAHPPGADRT